MDYAGIFQKCGMVESLPVRCSIQFKTEHNSPQKWNNEDLHREFPDLIIGIGVDNIESGFPIVVKWDVTGPRDQVLRFVDRFGNDNLRELCGIINKKINSGN